VAENHSSGQAVAPLQNEERKGERLRTIAVAHKRGKQSGGQREYREIGDVQAESVPIGTVPDRLMSFMGQFSSVLQELSQVL
jgi:hypothetical protein